MFSGHGQKSRVAPLKKNYNSKIRIDGCKLLPFRMAKMIERELDIKIDNVLLDR